MVKLLYLYLQRFACIVTAKAIFEYLSAFSYVDLHTTIVEEFHTYLLAPFAILFMIVQDQPKVALFNMPQVHISEELKPLRRLVIRFQQLR
jgi:hypothetical protein